MSSRKQSTQNGIKPLNLRMAPNNTARKLSREGEQFLSGEGLPQDGGEDQERALTGARWKNSLNSVGFGAMQDGSASKRSARAGRFMAKFRSTARSNNPDLELAARPYVRPWNQVHVQAPYDGSVGFHEQPLTKLAGADYEKRLRFEELKRMRLEAMCQWKQKDVKGTKKNAYIKQLQKKNSQILKVAEKSELEKLDVYTDRFPLLGVRKAINKSYLLVKLICFEIINTKLFDDVSLLVIVVNSVVMTVDDTATNDNPDAIWEQFERTFLVLYTIEMGFKIVGLTFIMAPDAYIRDVWNQLDFFIVMSSYLTMLLESGTEVEADVDQPGPEVETTSFKVSGLRVFRVLRPLKTISSVKGLKVLIVAVISALPLLKDTITILLFFFIIFAIATTQMFNGMLKQRCVAVQTGRVHEDDIICNPNQDSCPGGYFCAKAGANPNYGVTNFDNVPYAILAVFQCVTLEGWSEIQRDMQISYTPVIFVMFLPMVLLGAFFLLNLTLAVINSKFTESHNRQQELDRIELREQEMGALGNDDEEEATGVQDDLSITQFITARIYAKKMIEFLRMRQAMKRIEQERKQALLQQQKAQRLASRSINGQRALPRTPTGGRSQGGAGPGAGSGLPPGSVSLPGTPRATNGFGTHAAGSGLGHQTIPEDVMGEHRDVDSDRDQDKLDKDINDFLLKAKVDLQRQGHNAMDFKVPRIVGASNKKNGAPALLSPANGHGRDGAPTMKGNIEPIKKGQQSLAAGFQSAFAKRLAEEFDIDNVIEKADQKDQASEVGDVDSMASFQLSVNKYNYEINSQSRSSNYEPADPAARTLNEDMLGIPGVGEGEEEGLITSDSDFDAAAQEAGHAPPNMSRTATNGLQGGTVGGQGSVGSAKKEISRAFKKMLSLNYARGTPREAKGERSVDGGSTKYEGRSVAHQDFDVNSDGFELESKYRKRTALRKNLNKVYKEDGLEENALQELFEGQTDINAGLGLPGADRQEGRQIAESVSTKKPLDPYRALDPLTHKVVIAGDLAYAGTSQADVLQQRQVDKDKMALHRMNPYMKLPKDLRTAMQDEHEHRQFVKNVWAPHQQKFVYRVQLETTEEDVVSLNEDEIQAQEQPFYTPTRINYLQQTKQIHTKELAKRSDIMITSTLSMSLFPKDKRGIESDNHHRVLQSRKQIRNYLDEKSAFQALIMQHNHQNPKIRDKDKELRDQYVRNFLHKAEFESRTLKTFKGNVHKLNKVGKKVIQKDKNLIRQENIKHAQNIRASEKKGLPKFDNEDAQKLLQGAYHEEDEEDEEISKAMMNDKTLIVKTYAEAKHQEQVEKFEMQLKYILAHDDDENIVEDEVPSHLRREFAIPKNLDTNEIDFLAIRKHDASHKKISPMWSGQDVLPTELDNYKSVWVIDKLNTHRVWPEGASGIPKRLRYTLRLLVKSDFYDNFFTFFVFLNTITLSMDAYGITKEKKDLLNLCNTYFTWIFIVEMVLKQVAIGMSKYLADKMNWLDGFIVLSSIFELVFNAISGGEGVKGLSTLRMLRAIRVFRVLRLLRQLESMQTIISVMAKSYMSFAYITALMFLFIMIFTLLGMQTFAGYWKNDPEGLPANNYDSPGFAFFTIFQVLTMENWQSVMFVSMRNNETLVQNLRAPGILMLWIFIGNFILLNLFLAILLDSFLEDDGGLTEEELELLRLKKQKKKAHKKMMLMRKMVNMDTQEIKRMNKPQLSNWYFGQIKGEEEEDLEDLDEDQIVQIFKDMKIIKKDKHELKNQKMFVGIECMSSFYVFGKDNIVRVVSYNLIKHPLWETIVLGLITLSSLKLFYDTYFVQSTVEDLRWNISRVLDDTFNYLFIFEMSTKLIALGLIMDEGSYLRDTWNQMDFFIVTASIFDMLLQGKDLKVLKILRMLRTLRPLRFLTHNVGLKMIVNALIGSVSGIINVLLVIAVVLLIFAIIGVNLYSGKFFFCSLEPYLLHTQKDCEYAGGSWEQYDHNFDSTGRSWLTFFIIQSLEGWPDIFVQAVESKDVAVGPEETTAEGGNSPLKATLLIVLFIFLGSFFFLNFFIGVLFMKFNKAQEEERKGYTQKDLSWMDIQRLILSSEPDYETTNVPTNPFRLKLHTLVVSPQFEALIMGFILLNMVQMAALYEGAPQSVTLVLKVSNYIFAVIFLIEAILKGIAFGTTYFNNAWNKFDFFVVSASIFDFLLEILEFEGGAFLKVGPQIARVMRVLRVTRILRLAGKAEGLQAILQTIMFSIPALANVSILLFLIYFMMSVFANFQFNKIIGGDVIDPEFKNFKDGTAAFVLLFALSTGEDWNKVMFDCSRNKAWGCVDNIDCGSFASFLFFPFLIVVTSYVMLNLFILVIIQQFDQYYLPAENILGQFKIDQVSFMKIWREFTQDRYQCMKIKEKQLTNFFRKLGEENESLGFQLDQYDDGELKKNLLKMAIKSDNGYIFFNEMLYRCMRRKYGSMKINKAMQIFELRTQYQIYMMTLQTQNKQTARLSNDDIFNSLIKKENGVNPFLTVMNFKISFKTWLKVARTQLKQINEGDNYLKPAIEANKRTVVVDIEVEQFNQYSSEEELEHSMTMRSGTMSKSQSGSSNDLYSPSRSVRSKKDPLAVFEKKMQSRLMTQKIKQSMLLKNTFSPRIAPAPNSGILSPDTGRGMQSPNININLSQLQRNVEKQARSPSSKSSKKSQKQSSAQPKSERQLE